MTKKRKDYTQEFRDSAVKLITEQGYKISEAARNLGISVRVLGRWKRELEAGSGSISSRSAQRNDNVQAELVKLRKENQRLRMEREILKKSGGLLCKRVGVRYQIIDTVKKAYPIVQLGDVMEVSRSGYYFWKNRGKSARQQEYENLTSVVQEAHKVSKGTHEATGLLPFHKRDNRHFHSKTSNMVIY